MIFVDTGSWFARFVSDDPNYSRVSEFFLSNEESLFTTDFCVDETLTLLLARGRGQLAIKVGQILFDQRLAHLHFVTPSQIRSAWIVFQQRIHGGWSFTDCTSKVTIDEFEIHSALALDHHFHQFGIQILP